MSENGRPRKSSDQIRASVVDSGWSESPGPPSDPPSSHADVKTRQISAEKLAELVRSAESAPIDPSAPRDLPRYDMPSTVSEEPERTLEDLVPPEEMTKRIPYARLLGGSQAGRGGPSRPSAPPPPPSPFGAEESPADDEPLPSFPRAESQPDTPADSTIRPALESEPLPVFARGGVAPIAQTPASAEPTDDDLTVVHRLGPTLKPSRPPASVPKPPAPPPAPPTIEPEPIEAAPLQSPFAVAAEAPPPPDPALPFEVEPKPPVAPAAARISTRPPVLDLGVADAVEAERGLLAVLAQPFRLLGIKLPVWILLPVTAVAVFVPLYTWLRVAPPPPKAAPPATAPVRVPLPKPTAEPEKQGVHAQAAQGRIEAIERLKQIAKHERSVEDVLALARGAVVLRSEALAPLTERLEKDPKVLDDANFRKEFLEFVHDRNTYVDALAALAQVPSQTGPDLLYEVWTGTKKNNEITRLAKDLVYTKSARGRASDALSVALQLRSADSCEASKTAAQRALDYGDRRSVHLLGRLLSTRGCGPDKADDCYPCLRESELVQQAVDAVKNRKPPAF